MLSSTTARCCLLAALFLAGCTPKTSSSSSSSGGGGGAGFDAGIVSNNCLRDQECGVGKVCLGNDAGCQSGAPCTNDGVCGECESGGSLNCGFVGSAYCDQGAGVCRRILSSCEPCSADAQCGENIQLGLPNKCLSYPSGGKFCGLACTGTSCSEGFACLTAAGTNCGANGMDCACRASAAVGSCEGAVACSVEADCPTGTHCTTAASLTPRPGVCLAFCLYDNECPAGKVCQDQPGLNFGQCIQGCTPGQAGPNGTICHGWGRNGPTCPFTACAAGFECSSDTSGYCRLPGCQTDTQCLLARTVCDTSTSTCVPGCHTVDDCGAFELCTNGQCEAQGCRGKNLSCNMGQFCCGKELYDPATTGALTCPAGVTTGSCFNMPDPFCRTCADDDACGDITSFGQASHCYELQREAGDGGTASLGKFCSVGCRDSNDCPRGLPCQNLPAGQNGEMVKGCMDALCAQIHPSMP